MLSKWIYKIISKLEPTNVSIKLNTINVQNNENMTLNIKKMC